MDLLEVKNICKTYGSGETAVRALKDVSFSVPKGEYVAIVGESGSGKSTLLNMIGALDTPTSGKVLIDGRDVFAMDDKKLTIFRRRNIGFIFQAFNLIPELTVEQNIIFPVLLDYQKPDKAYLEELLTVLNLRERRHHLPSQLSGGQQQRVALARILCSEPQAILLDEPFSALDSYLKWNLELELSDLLAGFHGPILWVSHDLGECCRNCQKVCVMENGVSSPVTDMETLVRYPATQSAAQLTGCRNFLPAHRCEGGVCLDGWDILLPLHAAGERATVAVPDGAITVEVGTHTARVSRVIRDLNATAVVLRAAEATDAPPLCVVLPEGVRVAEGDTLSFSLLADRCRLWEE